MMFKGGIRQEARWRFYIIYRQNIFRKSEKAFVNKEVT